MIQWYDTNGRKQNLILLSFDLNGYNVLSSVIRDMPYFSFKIFDDNKLTQFTEIKRQQVTICILENT